MLTQSVPVASKTTKLFLLGCMVVCFLSAGCGGHSGGSALDSEMTLEEYNRLKEESASGMSAMPEGANQREK